MKFTQVVALRSWVLDGLGWCLRYSQSLFGAPVAFESARQAWDGQKDRHVGEWPPVGVQAVIWFDHWGTYGNPARYANWGHVAVALGDGRVLTSPLRNSQLKQWDAGKGEMVGSAIYPSILAMMRDLGGNPRYLGWSEYMNGLRVVQPTTLTALSGQEEDEDMPDSMFAVVDGVPSWCWLNWSNGRVFAVHTQAEANWIGGYMGSVKFDWGKDKLGSEKYKNKLALFGMLAPKVEIVPGVLTDADLSRLTAQVQAGVKGALDGVTFTATA